jgi:3-dehydroquinate synthetase
MVSFLNSSVALLATVIVLMTMNASCAFSLTFVGARHVTASLRGYASQHGDRLNREAQNSELGRTFAVAAGFLVISAASLSMRHARSVGKNRSMSEYADHSDAGSQAWISHSVISFDYRVVEVPRRRLLDPACDALIFGHMPLNSRERWLAEQLPQRRLIVIDETVHALYGDRVRAYFEARNVQHEILVLPMVEENKSMELTLEVAKKMDQFNIDRRTEPVIAIGGGVCLDVVGLASALFRRRTPYIRVPTTTLSYVDASVGAKNGCNFGGSKNRLGTYVPPCAALLDSSFFETQECRDVSNGMAEMVKMAIMKSEDLFCLLEEHGPRLSAGKFMPRDDTDDAPARVLRLSIETMLEELAPNLWEHSLDRLVDFGHAIGQDLEMAALGDKRVRFALLGGYATVKRLHVYVY